MWGSYVDALRSTSVTVARIWCFINSWMDVCMWTQKDREYFIFNRFCMSLENVCVFFVVTEVSNHVFTNFKPVYELTRTPPPLSPRRLPSRTYTHLTVKCLWVCFVIIKWQMTLWAAATLKWNVFFKAGGNRPCKRQSRLRKFGQSKERHTLMPRNFSSDFFFFAVQEVSLNAFLLSCLWSFV